MPSPLLRIKLHIPSIRPEWVSRPRLIARLDSGLGQSQQGFGRKLTLISAPAGFGKTSLLSEWVATCNQPVAWVTLDQSDNDPARFWAYVISALQTLLPDIGDAALDALQAPGFASASTAPSIKTLLVDLINEIIEIAGPLALVLDDLHLVSDPQIHETLAFFLDNLPPQIHLILASRSDPPWPMARLRARGEVTELRARDLRFTPEEVTAFLNEAMGLGLSADEIATLDARTEGWIAGLQLAALALQSPHSRQAREDVTVFIKAFSGSHRFILDYLVEEVLYQQPADIQEFLLYTSILEQLTAPLCDVITGRSDSQAVLTQLEQDNLFLIALDDERRWYRFHHLFADLLRNRLSQLPLDRVPALHHQASEWYEQNELITEAVHHAWAAEDIERVARLVAGNALVLMEHGELTTLERWLAALPKQVVRSQPWLGIAHAWTRVYMGQLQALEPLLQGALESLPSFDQPGEAEHLKGHIAAIRAYAAWIKGEGAPAAEHARAALEQLPEDDLVTRGFAEATLGSAHTLIGNLEEAGQSFTHALATSRAAGDTHVAMLATASLAYLRLLQGQLRQAAATCEEGLGLADEHLKRAGQRLPATGNIHAIMGAVLREWNDLTGATHHARQGIDLARQWWQIDTLTVNYVYLADTLRVRGEIDAGLEAVQEARQIAGGVSPWFDSIIARTEVQLHLAQGNLAAVSRWAQESGLHPSDEPDYRHIGSYSAVVLALIAQERLDEALTLLARLSKVAEMVGAMGQVIRLLAQQAIVLQEQGEIDRALTTLERALSLGQAEGYTRTFVDLGAPMGQLLRKALTRGIAPDYASTLLAALEGETKPEVRARLFPLVEPLSERELEVLRLLTTPLSSTEIAQELVIAPSTVRSHIKSIYGKLQVHGRTQAVARARELGLL